MVEKEFCRRCNRELKSEKSRVTGFGPVCKRKYNEEQDRLQTTIDEFIGENIEKDGTDHANN